MPAAELIKNILKSKPEYIYLMLTVIEEIKDDPELQQIVAMICRKMCKT